MRQGPSRWVVLAATLAVFQMTPARGGESPELRRYLLSIDSELMMRSPGRTEPKPILALTRMEFDWGGDGSVREIGMRELSVLVSTGGRNLSSSRIGADGATFRIGDQPAVEYNRDSSPPLLRSRLDDFQGPAARYSVDRDLGLSDRVLLISEESPIAIQGILETATFPFAAFAADRETWESPARLSVSSGLFADGTLRYQKQGTTDDGLVRVTVTGELTAEGSVFGGEVRKGRFQVTGEQFFDPAASAWTTADLEAQVGYELLAGGELRSVVSGTIRIHLGPETPGTLRVHGASR